MSGPDDVSGSREEPPWSSSCPPTPPTRTSRASSPASRASAVRRSSPRASSAPSSGWSATSTRSTTSTCAPCAASRTCTGSPTPTSWSAASTTPSAPPSGSARPAARCRSARTPSPSSPARAPSRPAEQTLEAAQMAQSAGATILRGGAYKPRTSPYAFQGLGVAGLEILADVARGDRPAGRHRGRRRPRRRRRRRARRHAADRHPQHGQLRAAAGGRRRRQAGAAQARDDRDHRGVADGGGVHRPARQPRRRALRARHPHLRAGDPQHPRHLRGAGRAGDQPPADHRRPVARRRAARTSSSRCRGPRSLSAPTGSSSTCTPTPRRRCATVRRRCSARSCATWPRPYVASRSSSAGVLP